MNLISFRKIIPVILWMLIILVLSGYPGEKLPEVPVWQIDKLVHTFIYGVLSILTFFSFKKQLMDGNLRLKTGCWIVLFVIFYGGLMEILQMSIFINRSGNWQDFIANSLGAFLGLIIFPVIIKFIPVKR